MLPAPPSRDFPAASRTPGWLLQGFASMESLIPLRAPAAPLCPGELGIRSGNEAQAEVKRFPEGPAKAAVVNPGSPSLEKPSTPRTLAEILPILGTFQSRSTRELLPLGISVRSGVFWLGWVFPASVGS